MAVRRIRGYITISDVSDGRGGITLVLSNENHTFPATQEGVVADAARTAFDCRVEVYVETTRYRYESGSGNPTASGRWKLGEITPGSGTTAQVTPESGATPRYVDITLTKSGNTGFFQGGNSSPDTLTIEVPILINIGGNVVSASRTITLAKAKGGSASLLQLIVTAFMIAAEANRTAKTPNATIIMTAALENIPGTDDVTWEYRASPSDNWAALPAHVPASGDDPATGFERSGDREVTIMGPHREFIALMGTSGRNVEIRASLQGREDVSSVALVFDGEAGLSEVAVRLIPRGSTILRNSQATSTVTVDAKLFFKGAEVPAAAISGYQWFVRANNADTNVAGNRGQQAALTVAANDPAVAGGAGLFGCEIAYEDSHAAFN